MGCSSARDPRNRAGACRVDRRRLASGWDRMMPVRRFTGRQPSCLGPLEAPVPTSSAGRCPRLDDDARSGLSRRLADRSSLIHVCKITSKLCKITFKFGRDSTSGPAVRPLGSPCAAEVDCRRAAARPAARQAGTPRGSAWSRRAAWGGRWLTT
jgi:hypothetical protein